MSKNALLIGGAGTGKTTRLLESVAKMLARGQDPYSIGFISFTNAATDNALRRAACQFGFDEKAIRRDGWFRTLHSFCYRLLNIKAGQILAEDSAAGRKWFSEKMGYTPGESKGPFDKSSEEIILAFWDVCRQRLEPWPVTWARCGRLIPIPALDRASDIIERYEQAKRLDNLSDFTDLLGRFSGVRFDTGEAGHLDTCPEGWLPSLDSIIIDEAQDNSPLMDRCLRRLADDSRFAILAGDPFQSIFQFSGSDASLFQAWPREKYEVMPQSHRCPARILELGERCLTHTRGYWDRKIAPRQEPGRIDSEYHPLPLVSKIDVRESWLLLARTNYGLSKFTSQLRREGIPYIMRDGGSSWAAPTRNGEIYSLLMLEQRKPITEPEWGDILKLKDLPVKFGDETFLTHGTKAAWKKRELTDELANLDCLEKWGATEALRNRIGNGTWRQFIPFADEYCRAVLKYGHKAVSEPRILVSTIHSAKGLEADNVALLTTTSRIVEMGRDDPDQRDEEHRLAYVGVTRAKKSLTVIDEPSEQFRLEVG